MSKWNLVSNWYWTYMESITDLHMVKKEMIHLYELAEFLLVSDLQTSADIKKGMRLVHDLDVYSQNKGEKTTTSK
jgi:hypothetical protein